MKYSTFSKSLAVIGAAACFVLAFAQNPRFVTVKLTGLRCADEDDPASRDEPFLIVTRFKARAELTSTGTARLVPGTLTVMNTYAAGHNNLGRSGDNWCSERSAIHDIPVSARQEMTESMPWGQSGWIAGAVVCFFEEDGFSDSTGRLLADQILGAVRTGLSTFSLAGVSTRTITDALAAKILGDIKRAVKNVNIGGLIRGLASAVDPDDFGGIAIVGAVTADGGRVFMFAGAPPADPASLLAGTTELRTSSTFSLAYPLGDLSTAPGNARYQGRCTVLGTISTGQVSGPY